MECSPPYDNADITSLIGTRVVCDVLATLVNGGVLPRAGGSPAPAPAPA